jgi:tight adherence protein B
MAAALLAGTTSSAWAAEGSIDHVENDDAQVQVLYSLPSAGDAVPDLSSLKVTLGDTPLKARAEIASESEDAVRRTAVLAIDVSDSMKSGGKFEAAKRAAGVFLRTAPDDLYIGVVTFAGKVTVAQEPSLDRAASSAVVDGLTLSTGTFLYDGLAQAVTTSGTTGQRSVIVLSDGRDTSRSKLDAVASAIEKSGVKVDVVALAQSAAEEARLQPLSDAGGGSVISASDPAALGEVFAGEAETLAKQILITAPRPAVGTDEGTLTVTVGTGGETYTDSAFVTLTGTSSTIAPVSTKLTAPPASRLHLTRDSLLAGLLALGAGVLVLLVMVFGGLGKRPEELQTTIAPYTRRGAAQRLPAPPQQGVTAQAVGLASKALQSNAGLETKLGLKLEAGGLTLKPAEWLLLHAGIAVGAMALAFLISGGDLLFAAIALLLGAVLPWLYLGRKQSKRLKAFNSQLAGTLQLMAGSLQAGLSLPQGMDTIVREGAEPVSDEFRRALVEMRLGVPVEDALQSIGERMSSADFTWTVMAIRIQREVGGNLAELMLNVAGTLRERDYLRRQVKSLSAEGRFSAYILLAMPPCILAYEATTNREYLHPLYTTSIGYVMLAAMVLLMGLGAFVMSRIIKLEV